MNGAPTTADRAATWYAGKRGRRTPLHRRSPVIGPRALEPRGLGTMHHVLVQLAQAELRPRFAEACRAFGDLVWCDDRDELVARAAFREALAVVIDLADAEGESTESVVRRIRAQRPILPIVLWAERATAAAVLPGFAAAGVSAIVFRDDPDLEVRLLSALTRARDVAFQQLTDQALHRRVPSSLIPVFRVCLDHAARLPRVEGIARSVGLKPQALASRLRQAGLPPLSAIVMWSRALIAAYRLEHSTEPVVEIARSLGFASGSALRRLLKRCANETPNGVRQPGGFGWTLRCYERYLGRGGRG